jgi:two-component system, NarL family, invasion response regulator UvrY
MTRILIVDDHELVRRGLRHILADYFPEIEVGEAADARQTLEAAAKHQWNVVLLDINMPGRSGIDVLQDLKRLYPQLPVLVLTAFPEKDYAIRAFKLGASGYVSKQAASGELIAAVRKALAGGRYITPSLADALAATVAGDVVAAPHEMLSNRELEVLREVALGKPLKQIAAELSLSEKTIGTYRMRISRKLGLATNVEIARYATRHHLVE